MKIALSELKTMCLTILQGKGLSLDHAEQIFNEYLDGELRGRSSHGFQAFVKFGAKLINPEGEPEVLKEQDNLLYINGKKNLGQIVCNQYMPQLIEKAKKHTIAMMGIYNMHSYLMPGTYARMAAEQDIISFIFNYGGRPRIIPTGSIDPQFGTNPLAIGIPTNDLPIVIDMATSNMALMKVRMAEKLGENIPEGVALDCNGYPTVDPSEAMNGGVLPFGGHKGYALALVIEILTNTMFNIDIHDKTKANRGFFFICFNPGVFQDIGGFKDNVGALIKRIKQGRKLEGVKEIFIPGEQSEHLKRVNSKKQYLEIDKVIINEINALL